MAHRNDLSFLCSSPASTLMPWTKGGALLTALCALVLLWGGATSSARAQPIVTDLRPESGAPGTQVRIYGSGFSTTASKNTVEFAATSVTPDSAKGTVLYVTVPSSVTGPVNVSVSTNSSVFVEAPEPFGVLKKGSSQFARADTLTGQTASEADFGDVDDDGDLDLVSIGQSSSGREVILYENQSGSLTQLTTFAPLSKGTVDFVDANGDGTMDIFVTGQSSSGPVTRLYTNDGSETFTAQTSTDIGVPNFGRSAVDFGDVDGDGDLDLVVAGFDGGLGGVATRVFFSDGDGTFTENSLTLTGVKNGSVDLGDVDGDGALDLFVTGANSSGSPTAALYVNDGTGNFSDSGQTFQALKGSSADFGDVDQDGDLDLVTMGSDGTFPQTDLYINDGAGAFSVASSTLPNLENGSVALGDATGDGAPDLLLTGVDQDAVLLGGFFRNDGTGSFASTSSVSPVTDGAVAFGDVNGDGGLAPFLLGNDGTGKVATLYRPVLALVNSTPPPNAQSVSPTRSLDLTFNTPVADLTGLADSIVVRGTQSGAFAEADGTVSGGGTDLLTYDPNRNFAPGERVSVLLRPGLESTGGLPLFVPRQFGFRAAATAGPAVFPTSRTVSSSENGAREVATGYLTGDGTLDLVVTSTGDTEVTVYPGNGDGTFGTPNVLDTSIQARALALADVDGDDLLDIVAGTGENAGGSSGGDILRYYVNQGSGSFGGGTDITNGNNADDVRDLAVSDLNGDGTQDLVAVTSDNSSILLYTNDGSGTFSEILLSGSASDPRAVTVADIDLNGSPDLVVGSVSDDVISWYPNRGDGTFGNVQFIDNGGAVNPRSLQTADFDQDGRPEVLAAERGADGDGGDGRVAVHHATVFNGSFNWNKKAVATTDSVLTATPADVNADGLIDIVAGSVGGDSLVWYENTGGGGSLSFGSGQPLDTGRHNVQDVIAGDLDGDGSLDPALTSVDQNTVATYPNVRPLELSNATPTPNTTDIDTSLSQISVTFNKALDAATADANSVALAGEQSGPVAATNVSVSDSTLTFTPGTSFQPGETITVSVLADSIADTDGVSLARTVSFSFTTTTRGGTGTFTAATSLTGVQGGDAAWGDYEGDGDLDLLLTGDANGGSTAGGETLELYVNDGSGTFTTNDLTTTTGIVGAQNGADVAWGDYDDDGDLDIVLTGYNGSTVADQVTRVYRQQSDGTFAAGGYGLTGVESSSASWADYDGDDDLDLAVTGFDGGSQTATLYRYDASTDAFTSVSVGLKGVQTVSATDWGDLDLDGDKDLVLTGNLGTTDNQNTKIYRNDGDADGDGTVEFTAVDVSSVIGGSVDLANYNGDNALDLVLTGYDESTSDPRTRVFRNDGSGTFTAVSTVVQQDSVKEGAVSWGDFTGDGRPDLVSVGDSTAFETTPEAAAQVFTYDGSGDPFTKISTSISPVDSAATAWGDYDGDGTLDLVVAGSDDSGALSTTLYKQTTPLAVTGTTPTRNATTVDTSLAGIDVTFNKTPDTDSVTAGDIRVVGSQTGPIAEADDSVGVSSNTATYEPARSFEPGETITVSLLKDSIVATDGTRLSSTNTFPFTAQAGNGPASFPVDRAVTTAVDSVQSAYPADFDGDGDLDVLIAAQTSDKIAWYENTGGGSFSSQKTITTSLSGAEWAHATDLDGDGDLDAISASGTDDRIAWYENQIGEAGADADGFGSQQSITTTADGAESVYAADVNGDGDQDILSSSQADNTIAWYENDGSATPGFTTHEITTTASSAEWVYTGDVDGDGVLDVLTASDTDDTIAWYENDGAATPSFTFHEITTGADGPESVYTGDLDEDGDLDVLSASHNDDTIAWYENDGTSTPGFTTRTITTSANGPEMSLDVGDVDGDGDLDVFSASANDGKFAWYENKLGQSGGGSDGFGTQQVIATTPALNGAQSLYAGDLDGDGDLDALGASWTADEALTWYPNTTIAPQVVTEAVSDTTADGFTATGLVNPGGESTDVTVQYGKDTSFGTDSTATAADSPIGGDDTTAVSAAVTGLDPATTYNYRVKASNATGTTTGSPLTVTTDVAPPGGVADAASSVSNDDATLNATVNPGGDTTRVYFALENTASGDASIYAADTLTTSLTDSQAVSVATPDTLKSDTEYTYEVSAANSADSTSLGTTSFTTGGPPVITGTTPSRNAASADTALAELAITFDKSLDLAATADTAVRVNGVQTGSVPGSLELDGSDDSELEFIPDAATPFQPGEKVSVSVLADSVTATDGTVLDSTETFRFTAQAGTGPAQFPVDSLISNTAAGPRGVTAADLDGDGDLDVLSAIANDNTVAWYENDGTGTLGPAQTITTTADGANDVTTADIDGDGDLDVVGSSANDNTVAWYENDGTATPGFTTRTITTSAGGALDVSVADVDGDGDLDVLSAANSDDTIAWYENTDGTGSFGSGQVIANNVTKAEAVGAADVDGDGDLDALSASDTNDTVTWYANDGTGNFGSAQPITGSADGAQDVVTADVDGDGDLDVISASINDNTVAWYENDGSATPGFNTTHEITTSASGAEDVVAADIDGDGDLDILASAWGDKTVAWYANDGSGSFGAEQVITPYADAVEDVAIGDIDGDGDLDPLSVAPLDNTVTWYPNTTIAPQVVTEAASDTTDDGFTAEAKVNPGGLDTEVTVQYSRNGTFGTDSSATAGASPLTGDDTTSVSIAVSGLAPNTTYDYRVRAANSDGTTVGTSRSITTRIAPPQVTTEAPTVESDTSATLTGTVNPGGDTTRVYATLVRTFDGDSTFVPVDTLRNSLLSDATSTLSVDTLRPSTEYRTRFAAANARDSTSGGPQTFVTAPTTRPDTTEIVQRGGPRRLDVLGNDSTGFSNTVALDPSTVRIETGPTHGTATVDATDGSIRYQHDGSDTKADTLTYTVANAAGQRSASTTVAIDVFDVQVQFGEPIRGDTVGTTLTVENGFAPTDDTTFAVRKGGTTSYQELELTVEEPLSDGTPGTVRFSAVIPDTMVTTRGIDYYAFFANGPDTLTVPAGGRLRRAQRRPRHLPVSFEALSPPQAVAKTLFPAEAYRMVSVPARLPGGLKAAFERSDAYGPYDPNEWRLERWNPAANGGRGRYDSYPALDSLTAGDGFWLTTRRGLPFTLPEGRTAEADSAQAIPLKAGWNQIGNPFGFAVPWDTVRAASGLSTADVDGPVGYGDGGFVPGRDSLKPWKGYFLYNATGGPDTLKVPPVGQISSSASALTTKAGSKEANRRPEAQLAEAGSGSAAKAASGRYTLQIQALSKSGTAEATLGLWPAAKAGRGPYDHAQPPSVTGGLRLSALETIGGTSVPHSHSIKPSTGNGRSWTLRLRALKGQGSQSAKLRLTGSGTLPDGHARYVLDLTHERRLTPGAELSLKDGETRKLKVIVGTEAYARKNSQGISLRSLKTTLRANYPNPFDEKTTVEYVLAESQQITIEIYNVLGQRVETLVDTRKSAGVHQATWDGTNRYGNRVGSGVYFIRLRAGDVTETQKAVLVR